MTIVESSPVPTGLGNPINSVRRCLVAGFGLLVLILIAVVAGSTYMVKQYQAEEISNRALLTNARKTAPFSKRTIRGSSYTWLTEGSVPASSF